MVSQGFAFRTISDAAARGQFWMSQAGWSGISSGLAPAPSLVSSSGGETWVCMHGLGGHCHHLLTLKETEGRKDLADTALAGSAPLSLMYVILWSCERNLLVLRCLWRHPNAGGHHFGGRQPGEGGKGVAVKAGHFSMRPGARTRAKAGRWAACSAPWVRREFPSLLPSRGHALALSALQPKHRVRGPAWGWAAPGAQRALWRTGQRLPYSPVLRSARATACARPKTHPPAAMHPLCRDAARHRGEVVWLFQKHCLLSRRCFW